MSESNTHVQPDQVRTPESVEQLARLWRCIGIEDGVDPVAIGAREHLRANRTEAPWCAVETTACDSVVTRDRRSGLVRLEAGMRWGALRAELDSKELGVELLALQPSEATIGGLLGRDRRFEPQFGRGDLRENCVGLATVSKPARSSTDGDVGRFGDDEGYTYRTAPRKASGPDLRYLAIGGESRRELILEATLVVTAPPALRLLRMPAPTVREATDVWRRLQTIGVRVGWVWWRRSEGVLWATMYGPERFLAAAERRLDEAPFKVGVDGASAARQKRRGLESQHPDRRSVGRGEDGAVWAMTVSIETLAKWPEVSKDGGGAEDLVITRWGRHRATVWLIGVAGEPPARVQASAMALRRVTDGYRRYELPTSGGDDVE